jgi:hypothetical protein
MAYGKKTGGRQKGTGNKAPDPVCLLVKQRLAELGFDPIGRLIAIAAGEDKPDNARVRILLALIHYLERAAAIEAQLAEDAQDADEDAAPEPASAPAPRPAPNPPLKLHGNRRQRREQLRLQAEAARRAAAVAKMKQVSILEKLEKIAEEPGAA